MRRESAEASAGSARASRRGGERARERESGLMGRPHRGASRRSGGAGGEARAPGGDVGLPGGDQRWRGPRWPRSFTVRGSPAAVRGKSGFAGRRILRWRPSRRLEEIERAREARRRRAGHGATTGRQRSSIRPCEKTPSRTALIGPRGSLRCRSDPEGGGASQSGREDGERREAMPYHAVSRAGLRVGDVVRAARPSHSIARGGISAPGRRRCPTAPATVPPPPPPPPVRARRAGRRD